MIGSISTVQTSTGYALVVSTDQAERIFWIATQTPVRPSASQIRYGQDASGQPALSAGSVQADGAGDVGPLDVGPVDSGALYYFYAVQRDGAGYSNVVTTAVRAEPAPMAVVGSNVIGGSFRTLSGVTPTLEPLVSFYSRKTAQSRPDFGT